jgi:hypothetical protein
MMHDRSKELYSKVRHRALEGQVWSLLTRRSRGLLSLTELTQECAVSSSSDAGIRTVPIKQIRGSEGRSHDFDRDFNPLQDHTRMRWLGIAAARQAGKSLPPVSLIQVGDVYFVRDGHHRISVARAIGQCDIEAEVTVWQVARPLPWETQAPAKAPRHRSREPQMHRLARKVREGAANLQRQSRIALHGLLAFARPS